MFAEYFMHSLIDLFCLSNSFMRTVSFMDPNSSCDGFKNYFNSFGLFWFSFLSTFIGMHIGYIGVRRLFPYVCSRLLFTSPSPRVEFKCKTWRRPRLMSKLFLPKSLQVNFKLNVLFVMIRCSHMTLSCTLLTCVISPFTTTLAEFHV